MNQKPSPEAAIVLVTWNQYCLILLRSPESPMPNTFCIPGGKLDPGEEPLVAARRELEEETGINVHKERMTKIADTRVLRSPKGVLLHSFHIYLHPLAERNLIALSREHTGYMWVDPAKAWVMELPWIGAANTDLLRDWVATRKYSRDY